MKAESEAKEKAKYRAEQEKEARLRAEAEATAKAEEAKRAAAEKATADAYLKAETEAKEKARAEARTALELRLRDEAIAKSGSKEEKPVISGTSKTNKKYNEAEAPRTLKYGGKRIVHIPEKSMRTIANTRTEQNVWYSSYREIFSLPNDPKELERQAGFFEIKDSSFSKPIISRLTSSKVLNLDDLANSSRKKLSKIYGWSRKYQDEIEEFFVLLSNGALNKRNSHVSDKGVTQPADQVQSEEMSGRDKRAVLSTDLYAIKETLSEVLSVIDRIHINDYYEMLLSENRDLFDRHFIRSPKDLYVFLDRNLGSKYRFGWPYISLR